MDKPTFMACLQTIVEGFENPAFKERFAAAKASGDVATMMALPMEVQGRAFGAFGLDATTGSAQFKEAGRQFAFDADVLPWLTRMKAAL